MKKELLTVELRYHGLDEYNNPHSYTNRITIGIFDSLKEAVKKGNEVIGELSKTFQVRDGDRFEINGLFGYPKRLVTNCCYPTKKVQYFATITCLDFCDLSKCVDEAILSSVSFLERKDEDD